jgi:hypothetical protein
MPDELEPLQGTYDWDSAFAQNPDEPMYEVTAEQRGRHHHLPTAVLPAFRPVAGFREIMRETYGLAFGFATSEPDDVTLVMAPLSLEGA